MEISSQTLLYRVETEDILPTIAWFFPNRKLAEEYLYRYKHEYLGIPLEELKIRVYQPKEDLFLPILDSEFTAHTLDLSIQRMDPTFIPQILAENVNNYHTATWFLDHNLPGWVAFRGSDRDFGLWTRSPNYYEIMLTHPERKILLV